MYVGPTHVSTKVSRKACTGSSSLGRTCTCPAVHACTAYTDPASPHARAVEAGNASLNVEEMAAWLAENAQHLEDVGDDAHACTMQSNL